jgi:hypothetical protein
MPDLFEYRDGTGAWQPVAAPDSFGVSVIHVHADYEVLALCAGDGSAFDATMQAATVGDGDRFINCFPPPAAGGTPPPTFAVTGTMKQAGSIQLESDAAGATSPWSFDVAVPDGTYDLAALDTAQTKMLLRRGLTVAGAPLAVATQLDLDTEGAALVPAALTVTNGAPQSSVGALSLLFTANAFIRVSETQTATAQFAPSSVLTANDVQELEVAAGTATTSQQAFADVMGPGALPTSFALLALPTAVTFANATGTVTGGWTTVPDAATSVEVFVQNDTQQQVITATVAWLAAHHATDLTFDTSATGYKAIWDVDLTKSYFAELSVSRFDATTGVTYTSGIADTGSPLRRGHHARTARLAQLAPQVMGASRKIFP